MSHRCEARLGIDGAYSHHDITLQTLSARFLARYMVPTEARKIRDSHLHMVPCRDLGLGKQPKPARTHPACTKHGVGFACIHDDKHELSRSQQVPMTPHMWEVILVTWFGNGAVIVG